MTDVTLYDEIGIYGTRASEFAERLKEAGDGDITLRVNSPGGDVYEGLAIMNQLRNHPGKVTAYVEGLAASAASFIVVGGASEVVMNKFKGRRGAPPADLITKGDEMADNSDLRDLVAEMKEMGTRFASVFAAVNGLVAEREAEQAEADEAAPEELADGVEDVEQPEPGEAQPEPGEHEEVSEEEAEEPAEVEQPAEEDGDRPEETVTIDAATYAELKAAAEHGWAAAEEKAKAERAAEVDNWISEGRISAALRSKAVAAIERDADAARATYGSNPKGTIPRAALGHAVDEAGEKSSSSHLSNSADASGLFGAPTF